MRLSFAKKLTASYMLVVVITLLLASIAHRHFVLAGVAALAVALAVAFFTVRRVTRPVSELTAMAESIGREHSSNLLPENPKDEFERLTLTFSAMARRIEDTVREISAERTQLEAILSSLIEGVIALDHQERILFLNPAAERLFGVRANAVKGRRLLEALRHSPLNSVIARTTREGQSVEQEIVLHALDEHLLAVHTVPVHYGESRSGVVAALHDITELRKLERVRYEFVANASHELKTPLTSIKGYVETLLDGALEDPKNNRAFLEIIQEQTHRLIRLIEDLLDLSAIEARRMPFRLEAVRISDVVDRVWQALAPMAKAKNVTMDHQISPDLPAISADREKLAQILLNLLDNAIKFNRSGGQVSIRAAVDENRLRVSVSDTGPGIDPADLPRVFERFFRGDKSHSHDISGTGLGLSIVKHLVDAHGGAVSAESQPGQGSTFHLSFPLAP